MFKMINMYVHMYKNATFNISKGEEVDFTQRPPPLVTLGMSEGKWHSKGNYQEEGGWGGGSGK